MNGLTRRQALLGGVAGTVAALFPRQLLSARPKFELIDPDGLATPPADLEKLSKEILDGFTVNERLLNGEREPMIPSVLFVDCSGNQFRMYCMRPKTDWSCGPSRMFSFSDTAKSVESIAQMLNPSHVWINSAGPGQMVYDLLQVNQSLLGRKVYCVSNALWNDWASTTLIRSTCDRVIMGQLLRGWPFSLGGTCSRGSHRQRSSHRQPHRRRSMMSSSPTCPSVPTRHRTPPCG